MAGARVSSLPRAAVHDGQSTTRQSAAVNDCPVAFAARIASGAARPVMPRGIACRHRLNDMLLRKRVVCRMQPSAHKYLPWHGHHYAGHTTRGQYPTAAPFSQLQEHHELPHGQGTWFDADSGDKFECHWHLGVREGFGVHWASDGSVYRGEWSGDLACGEGTRTSCWGEETYKGQWVAGKQEGRGIATYANGDEYDGLWKAGLRHGRGELRHACGDRYDGEWVDAEKDGHGVYEWAAGDRYEGQWKAGRKDGFGIYYCASGDRYEGEFLNDVKEGRCTCWRSNGDVERVVFQNDEATDIAIRWSPTRSRAWLRTAAGSERAIGGDEAKELSSDRLGFQSGPPPQQAAPTPGPSGDDAQQGGDGHGRGRLGDGKAVVESRGGATESRPQRLHARLGA